MSDRELCFKTGREAKGKGFPFIPVKTGNGVEDKRIDLPVQQQVPMRIQRTVVREEYDTTRERTSRVDIAGDGTQRLGVIDQPDGSGVRNIVGTLGIIRQDVMPRRRP